MQNKRRRALAEKIAKIADDYKKVSQNTRLCGRNANESEELRRFKSKTEKYSLALTSAALKIAEADTPLTAPELKAERFINNIFAENYTVMIYDGEIGDRLADILGAAVM